MARFGSAPSALLLAAALAATGCGGDSGSEGSGGEGSGKEAGALKQDGPQREVAGVGSGKAGRSLDDLEGMTVTPIKQYFRMKEKIAYEIQLKKNLSIFQGLHGRLPESHDEFERWIIKEWKTQLPELPEGRRYVWDPQQKQLMVEKVPPPADGETPAKQP